MNAAEGLWSSALDEGDASPKSGESHASAEEMFSAGERPSVFDDAPASASGAASDHFDDEEPSTAQIPNELLVMSPASNVVEVASRPAPPRAPRESGGAGSKLAKAVSRLLSLETRMAATLAAHKQALKSLEDRRTYKDAGYASYSELEPRIVRVTPMLQALRNPAARVSAPPSTTTSETPPRKTKALVVISRALSRSRSLEERMKQHALDARRTLATIDTERLFEECGYTSYEDFLSRALGPRSLLSDAVALVADVPLHVEPAAAPERQAVLPSVRPAAEAPAPAESAAALWSIADSEAPALLAGADAHRSAPEPESSDPTTAPDAPPGEATPSMPALPIKKGLPKWAVHAAMTVVLALAATGIGAATGGMGRLQGAHGPEAPDASVLGAVPVTVASATEETAAPKPHAVGAPASVEEAPHPAASEKAVPAKPAREEAKAAGAGRAAADPMTDALRDALQQASRYVKKSTASSKLPKAHERDDAPPPAPAKGEH